MRLAGLALLLLATGAAADSFTLDRKKSELVVKTTKDGIASGLAHDHVVQATSVSGELTWDPADPQKTAVSVTVQVAALVADRPEVRKRHGHTRELSQSDQRKVTDAMLGPDQLDVAKFPTITFVSTGLTGDAKGPQVIKGNLTMHGVTRAVKVPVKISAKDGGVEGDARLKLKVSDYGIKPYSTALGTIRNQDEVELVLHLVGAPK